MTTLGIVIPALNAAPTMEATLASLQPGKEVGLVAETVVVDGGSTDGTPEMASRLGATVVGCAPGRGGQLAEGARRVRGDWLLFVHADTRLAPDWAGKVGAFTQDPANAAKAGHFRFALDAPEPAARRLERAVAWRSRALGLPYGDQGLLISRALYDAIGGFRPLVLMEDVDIVRRIGRCRLVAIDCTATTSAARYRRSGYVRRSARNVSCLALYFMGVPPRTIARIYG